MNNEISNENTIAGQVIKQAIAAWDTQAKNVTKYFKKYPDELYMEEIAPGKNRAIYLLGHFVATTDNMLDIMGKGDKRYPELAEIFVASPDKAVDNIPSLQALKEMWENLVPIMLNHFNEMPLEDWMTRHTKVSPEDFALEPHRNKLSILLSRTGHMSYHLGQLALLKEAVAA